MAAALLLDVHLVDGGLRRVSRDGVVGAPAGVLEDYADVAEGLLALYAVTGENRWYAAVSGSGRGHGRAVLGRARPAGSGTLRPRPWTRRWLAALGGRGRAHDPTDGATPSGTSAAAGVLLTWAALTGSGRHRELAERALAQGARVAAYSPRMAGWHLAVTEALVDGPREVAVVGAAGRPAAYALHAVALAGSAPGLVVALGGAEPDAGAAPAARRPAARRRAARGVPVPGDGLRPAAHRPGRAGGLGRRPSAAGERLDASE